MSKDSVSFQFWRKISLDIGGGEHNLRDGASFCDGGQFDVGIPLILFGIESSKGEGFFKVAVVFEAEKSAFVDIFVVPEVCDGCLCKKEQS